MQKEVTPARVAVALLALAFAVWGAGCREEAPGEKVAERFEQAAENAEERSEKADMPEPGIDALNEAAQNVENAAEVYGEAYDEARARGENPIDASSDAYDAVVERGEEKAE